MRRKSYFLCAHAQVIGWVGPSATTPRPSSSGNDYNCGRNTATSEFHCAQPRRVTKMVLDAPECVQTRTFDSHLPRQLGGSAGPPQQCAPFHQEATTCASATPSRGTNLPHCQSWPPMRCWTPIALWIQISRVESRNPRWFGISSRSPQRVLLMPRRVLESISWLAGLLAAACLLGAVSSRSHNIRKAGW